MALTKTMIDLGKPVTYFPNLRRITSSTAATLFLSQLIYWCDKTKDNGWIWKNSMQIAEETGLTYNEQRSARKRLVELGLIQEREQKTKHRIDFKVNQEKLDELWNQYGDGSKTYKPAIDGDEEEFVEEPQEEHAVVTKQEVVAKQETPKTVLSVTEMEDLIQAKLHINPTGSKWEAFIGFAYSRERDHGEKLETFIDWALANNFSAIYWTPEKMMTIYPQAFVPTKKKAVTEDDDFKNLLPQISKDKVSVPMPKSMRKSNDW